MLRRILAWKYPIAVVVILGCSVFVSHQDQKTRDQYEQKCAQFNARAITPPAHSEDCDKGAENAARHLPRWYRIFGWPEGITTWAILLTLLALAEQTNQTKRAAVATEESVGAIKRQADIQAVAMQQWVDVETRGVEVYSRREEAFVLQLQFEAVNNTGYLLTIEKIVTTVALWADSYEVFTIEATVPLPPSREGKISGHPFYVQTGMETKDGFERGTTLFTINGEVTFTDCIGKPRIQWFGGLYECRQGHFAYYRGIGYVPDKEKRRYQNPN